MKMLCVTPARVGNDLAVPMHPYGNVRGRIILGEHGRLEAWIRLRELRSSDCMFPSHLQASAHLSTRQYARLVHRWTESIGLDDTAYRTHTMRRTKVSLIYRRTKNRRAVQLLLGHAKLESTVRYLGIEVDDALEMAEHTEV